MLSNEIQQDELERLYNLNIRILDVLQATVSWILADAKENGKTIPHLDALRNLMREAIRLISEIDLPSIRNPILSDGILQGKRSDDKPPDKLPVYLMGGVVTYSCPCV